MSSCRHLASRFVEGVARYAVDETESYLPDINA